MQVFAAASQPPNSGVRPCPSPALLLQYVQLLRDCSSVTEDRAGNCGPPWVVIFSTSRSRVSWPGLAPKAFLGPKNWVRSSYFRPHPGCGFVACAISPPLTGLGGYPRGYPLDRLSWMPPRPLFYQTDRRSKLRLRPISNRLCDNSCTPYPDLLCGATSSLLL
jgi:hypothetical protein